MTKNEAASRLARTASSRMFDSKPADATWHRRCRLIAHPPPRQNSERVDRRDSIDSTKPCPSREVHGLSWCGIEPHSGSTGTAIGDRPPQSLGVERGQWNDHHRF